MKVSFFDSAGWSEILVESAKVVKESLDSEVDPLGAASTISGTLALLTETKPYWPTLPVSSSAPTSVCVNFESVDEVGRGLLATV